MLPSNSEIESQAALKYAKLFDEIKSCNTIKFAAYRTASKILVLQKFLGFNRVTLQIIKGVLERHNFRATDNYLVLSVEEISNVLHDVFYAASTEEDRSCVQLFVELSKLLLQDIFLKNGDLRRITVLDLKIILVCLCSSSLYSKYLYWFSQLLDHNLCLPRRRFHILLETLLLMTNYLAESSTFSNDLIQPTLDTCYTEEHHFELGISEDDFVTWLGKEPQLLVWLSTFYRMSISQKVTHNVECSVCGMFPIIGLRYHCLRCIRYDLCQLCFFTARSSKHHKPKHIIKEYCSQTSFVETASSFIKEIFKRLCGQSAKLQYLPVYNNFVCKSVNGSYGNKTNTIEDGNIGTRYNVIREKDEESKIKDELRGIIVDIEKGSSDLLNENCDTKHLLNHQIRFLEECLQRVKALQAEVDDISVVLPIETSPSSCTTSSLYLSSIEKETNLCVPSISGFSTWLESAQHETTYTKQLQTDLDNIMTKLNNMLESNFSINEDE